MYFVVCSFIVLVYIVVNKYIIYSYFDSLYFSERRLRRFAQERTYQTWTRGYSPSLLLAIVFGSFT